MKRVTVRLCEESTSSDELFCDNKEDAIQFVRDRIVTCPQEVMAVINFDCHSVPINYSIVAIGTSDSVETEPKELLKSALLSNAYGIILIHNHPSGILMPSKADCALTDTTAMTCRLAGLVLMDHIIVGSGTDQILSMKDDIKYRLPGKEKLADAPEDIRWDGVDKFEGYKDEHSLLLYLPDCQTIMTAACGSGVNLEQEDLEAGYDAYIEWSTAQYVGPAVEDAMFRPVDGGMLMYDRELVNCWFDKLDEAVEQAVGSKAQYIILGTADPA